MKGELPLRVVSLGNGVTIRCLCGAESAVTRPPSETVSGLIRANHGSSVVVRNLAPDGSAAAVLRMVAHARSCRNIR